MKTFLVSVLATLTLIACGGESTDGALADGAGNEMKEAPASEETKNTDEAKETKANFESRLAECASGVDDDTFDLACADPILLEILTASQLRLAGEAGDAEGGSTLAIDYYTESLDHDSSVKLSYKWSPTEGTIVITVDVTDNGTDGESTESFSFTLEGDTVKEEEVPLTVTAG